MLRRPIHGHWAEYSSNWARGRGGKSISSNWLERVTQDGVRTYELVHASHKEAANCVVHARRALHTSPHPHPPYPPPACTNEPWFSGENASFVHICTLSPNPCTD